MLKLIWCPLLTLILCLLFSLRIGALLERYSRKMWGMVRFFISIRYCRGSFYGLLLRLSSWWFSIKRRSTKWAFLRILNWQSLEIYTSNASKERLSSFKLQIRLRLSLSMALMRVERENLLITWRSLDQKTEIALFSVFLLRICTPKWVMSRSQRCLKSLFNKESPINRMPSSSLSPLGSTVVKYFPFYTKPIISDLSSARSAQATSSALPKES